MGRFSSIARSGGSLVKFAAQEADRLGLEVCIHNCGGWSSSGGPWNTPEHGMQVVVTSEKAVSGPGHFEGLLPQPKSKLGVYHDIAVLAFPTPAGEALTMKDAAPKIITSGKNSDGAKLIDGKSNTYVVLPLPAGNARQFITLEFARPFAAREISITPGPGFSGAGGKLEASDDGRQFRTLTAFSLPRQREKQTFTFAATTARYYRVLFVHAKNRAKQLPIAEVEVSSRLAIADLAGKAFYVRGSDARPGSLPEAGPEDVVPQAKIVDLSAAMTADGKVSWEVPAGKWTILRAGYTPNGARNHPAPPEGEGLECDKLSKEAAIAHWEGSMGKLIAAVGPLAGRSLNGVLIDSYEVGTQNWTPKFREEFRKRRGYDAVRFMPVLAGRVVESLPVSERFLWDMRRTIADLFAENYSGTFAELAHRNGLKYSVEPYGNCPTDDLQYGQYADIPMSEFWPGEPGNTNPGNARLAASVGHVFGRKIVGAESFTAAPDAGKWLKDPYALKAQGDTAYCAGVNRIIYHRYAHQPWLNRFPGMTMGQWGTHFERTVTWWEQSTAWLKYQARCQYLLQSGLFVADACFFCGEGAPNGLRGSMPPGYDYDGCNTDALLHRMSVQEGRIVLPDGMSYRLLVLPDDGTMTPAVLHKIKELADAGATILGPKPTQSPSLTDYPNCDAEVKQIADALWSRTIVERPLETALAALRLPPDFQCDSKQARLNYIHRRAGGADIYFVSNPKETVEEAQCTFRVSGKAPEFWHADTGKIEMAPLYAAAGGRTTVPVRLDPSGSVFVVFRQPLPADHVVTATTVHGAAPGPVAPPSDLTILKAEYGDFGEALNQCVDVTAVVRKMIKDGVRKVTANNDLAGDPASMVEKQLRVRFAIQGVHKTVTVAENQSLELPAGAQVIKATYGALGDEPDPVRHVIDVTGKLSSAIQDGALNVRVDLGLIGSDPAINVVKELRVDYRYRGLQYALRRTEGQQLNLPEHAEPAVPPPASELTIGGDGRLQWEAWQAGSVEATTAAGKRLQAQVNAVAQAVEINGPWEVRFPPQWGAPEKITLPQLISWTQHPDRGVKYFSGTAVYAKDMEISATLLGPGKSLYLDLGRLKNLAQVKLNGTDLGILWKRPFRVEITAAAHVGINRLEVQVTNLWPNRLIGDEQLPEDRVWQGMHLKEWPQWLLDGKPSPTGRFTFTTWHHWSQDDAPLESGILGPVALRPSVHVPLTAKSPALQP